MDKCFKSKSYLDQEEFQLFLELARKIAKFNKLTKEWCIDEEKVRGLTREEAKEVVEGLSKFGVDVSEIVESAKAKGDGKVVFAGNYVTVKDDPFRYEELLTFEYRHFDPVNRQFVTDYIRLIYQTPGGFKTYRGFLWRLVTQGGLEVSPNAYEEFPLEVPKLEAYEERDYQVFAVQQWLRAVNLQGSGLIQAPTGSGKSVMAVMAVKAFLKKYPDAKVVYITLNTTLLKQFQQYLKREGLSSGIIGGGIKEFNEQITNVSVMTVYRALHATEPVTTDYLEDEELDYEELSRSEEEKLKELMSEAKLIIIDEAHHVPASSVREILKAFPGNIRLGLSATPYRDDQKEYVIYSFLSDPVVKYRLKDFIKKGVLVPPTVKMVYIKPDVKCRKKGATYMSCASEIYEDEKSNSAIAEVIAKAEKPVLALFKTVKQLELVSEILNESGIEHVVLTGKNDLEEREEVIRGVNAGKVQIVLATTIFDEGVDIPNIRSLVLASGGKSKTKLLQRIGRSLRKATGKDNVTIYDIVHDIRWFKEQAEVREDVYNEEDIKVEKIYLD